MRFLADENFPGDAVTALRTLGHDVLWIRTDTPGITDEEVLRMTAGQRGKPRSMASAMRDLKC